MIKLKKSSLLPIVKSTKKIIKELDLFGSPILLSYKNDNAYKTKIGGLISIATVIILAFYFYAQVLKYFNKEMVNTKTKIDYSIDPLPIELNKENFMFAINVD